MFRFRIVIQINLPLLNTVENKIKKSLSISLNFFFIYRINYFSLPLIPEMGLIYFNYSMIYDYVSSYRLQLDFVIKRFVGINNSCEFLLRFYRLPCAVNLKKQLTIF